MLSLHLTLFSKNALFSKPHHDWIYFQSKIDGDQIRFAFVKLGDVEDLPIHDERVGRSVVDLPIHDERVERLAVIEFEPIGDVEGMTTELRIDHAQISESLSIKLLNGSIEFLPSKTVLLQNYPNPFNPETWIPYQLTSDAAVTISVYNTEGQLIRTIDLGNQKAGAYTGKDKAAYWDGKDSLGQPIASGVYFYTLQAGEFSATRKMAILK